MSNTVVTSNCRHIIFRAISQQNSVNDWYFENIIPQWEFLYAHPQISGELVHVNLLIMYAVYDAQNRHAPTGSTLHLMYVVNKYILHI